MNQLERPDLLFPQASLPLNTAQYSKFTRTGMGSKRRRGNPGTAPSPPGVPLPEVSNEIGQETRTGMGSKRRRGNSGTAPPPPRAPSPEVSIDTIQVASPTRSKRKRGTRGRKGRGKRSRSAEKRRIVKARYYARIPKQYWIPDTVRVPYPTDFIRVRKSADLVTKVITERFSHNSSDSKVLPQTGTLALRAPIPVAQQTTDHPSFIGLRLDAILRVKVQEFIIKKFDGLLAAGVPHYENKKKKDSRSATPAFHFGIWSLYSSRPRLTSATLSSSLGVQLAIDKFLTAIQKYIVPLIVALLRQYAPACYARQMRAWYRVRRLLRVKMGQRSCVDFQGAFFTIAVKEGSSERVHVDWNDDPTTPTWIIPLGQWEGASLFCPQLGVTVPINPGQIFGGLMRRIAHASTPLISGRRIVVTCFCDGFTMRAGDKDKDKYRGRRVW